MTQVSLLRLYALRAAYLLLVVGLGLTIWPNILNPDKAWPLMFGVVQCVLAAVSLLALLGLRYPLKMLPLLMFELIWKGMWLGLVGIPAWQAGGMSAGTSETLMACAMGVIFPLVIPWRYVWTNYVAAAGDRWK
ncbi:MAG: hypothetical protein K9G59_03030 [Caulobacter sp.]|nr:hypothetical protein [Caulobacter sp.]